MTRGEPDKTYAIVLATMGFAFFLTISLLFFLLPEKIRTAHIVLGCITGLLALLMYPWQVLDLLNREYRLEESSLIYRAGVLTRYEAEIPYSSIKGISVKQGILQRIVGCADVRVTAPGIQDPHTISSTDLNSLALRSVRNHGEVSQTLREKMRAQEMLYPAGDAHRSVKGE